MAPMLLFPEEGSLSFAIDCDTAVVEVVDTVADMIDMPRALEALVASPRLLATFLLIADAVIPSGIVISA